MENITDDGVMVSLMKKFRFILYGLICILVLARDIGGIDTSRFLFIGIAAVICILSECAELLCLAAFVAPLHTGIPGTFIVLVVFLVYIFKKRWLNIRHEEIGAILIVLLLEMINGVRGDFSVIEYLRFAAYFLLVFLIILDKGKYCDGERVSLYFLAGYVIALISIWGQMLGKYSFDQILKLGIRFGDVDSTETAIQDTMRVSFNQNDLGFVCAIVAVLSLIFRKRQRNPLYYIIFIVSILTCIMTMSRGAVLSLVIGLVLYFLFTSTNIKGTLRNILFATVGITVMIYLVYTFIPTYFTGLIERFAGENLLNGRDTIMMYYNEELMAHVGRLVFGVGLQNYPEKYGYHMSAHNAIQETVIAWGVIGLFTIIFLFVRGIRTAKILNATILREQYIPLIILIIGLQSGQGFSQYAHMLYFLVAYSALYMEAENAGEVKNG